MPSQNTPGCHRKTRLENGEVVVEAVAALHTIKGQSRAAHCREEHDACMSYGDAGSNGGGQSQDIE